MQGPEDMSLASRGLSPVETQKLHRKLILIHCQPFPHCHAFTAKQSDGVYEVIISS
ncbi:hypothetical protein Mapa_011403 [Marchantia paleacea]|nr:hypothetical protein Mapa_011403 [Marchantia paleacea]